MSPIRFTIDSADTLISKALRRPSDLHPIGLRRGFIIPPSDRIAAFRGTPGSGAEGTAEGHPGVVVTLSAEATRIAATARPQLQGHTQGQLASGRPGLLSANTAGETTNTAGAGDAADTLLYDSSGGRVPHVSTQENPQGTLLNVRV